MQDLLITLWPVGLLALAIIGCVWMSLDIYYDMHPSDTHKDNGRVPPPG